ncbi:hypothetical protein JHK87_038970 [Glycine soja]|nr:hypothetical protein JHK87_038970 [Glycine soja]
MDLCYHAPASLAAVPAVTLVFSGAEMRVSGERLLYRQNVWMEFDLVKSRVGFTETTCDLASQRLGFSP